MSCIHVLSLIDRLPTREWRSGEFERVERHLCDCARCRSVFVAARELESQLTRLPAPPARPELSANIASRASALYEERRSRSNDVKPAAPIPADRRAWATMLLGAANGVGAQIYGLVTGAWSFEWISPFFGGSTGRVLELLQLGPSVYFLATGLLLYLAGLFGLRRD